ncbi:hypothetical protein MRX96_042175 [Rhipicephalus microplus]
MQVKATYQRRKERRVKSMGRPERRGKRPRAVILEVRRTYKPKRVAYKHRPVWPRHRNAPHPPTSNGSPEETLPGVEEPPAKTPQVRRSTLLLRPDIPPDKCSGNVEQIGQVLATAAKSVSSFAGADISYQNGRVVQGAILKGNLAQ